MKADDLSRGCAEITVSNDVWSKAEQEWRLLLCEYSKSFLDEQAVTTNFLFK
jgi:hypothetical protein